MFSLSQGLCGPDKNRLELISTGRTCEITQHSLYGIFKWEAHRNLFSAWETPELKGDKELGITAFVFTVT